MTDDSQTVEWRRERADALSATQRKRADARTCTAPLEFRENTEDGGWTVRSYASLFNSPYTIGTGAYRFTETVKPGAFRRSLGSNPDVVFRTEHSNAPLAATWNDTLRLGEDNVGFWYEADLNPEDPDAQTLRAKIKRGDYRESSFAFRIMGENGDNWNDDRSERELVACDINRGDVSVVTFGASSATGQHMILRSALETLGIDAILQLRSELEENEERIGAMISQGSMEALRNVLGLIATADDAIDQSLESMSGFMGVPNPNDDEHDDDDESNAAVDELEHRAKYNTADRHEDGEVRRGTSRRVLPDRGRRSTSRTRSVLSDAATTTRTTPFGSTSWRARKYSASRRRSPTTGTRTDRFAQPSRRMTRTRCGSNGRRGRWGSDDERPRRAHPSRRRRPARRSSRAFGRRSSSSAARA